MTSTLLIRLEAPIQSWGDAASKWDYRTTGPRPTKSGVIGLIANAMGRDFTDPIDDLAALRFAVRADRPGHVEIDTRIAGGGTFPLDARTRWDNPKLVPSANGRINYGAPRAAANHAWTAAGRAGVFRTATFLAHAAFLASVTGDDTTIADVADALQRPARLVVLGRRAHPPAHDLHYRTLDGDHHTDWVNSEPVLPGGEPRPRVWIEDPDGQVAYEQPATGLARGAARHPTRIATYTSTPPLTTHTTTGGMR